MGQLPVFLDDVIVTSELTERPSKPPDYRAEVQAIKMLVTAMSEDPDHVWQRLADSALQLCRGGTAGVSLLDASSGEEVFRLIAVAGVLTGSIPSTISRGASPCGTAIDRNGTQLVRLPERFFSSLKFDQPIAEALIIPFHVQGKPAGTVWIVAHDDSYRFDREDERLGKTLGSFAAAAAQIRNAPAGPARVPAEGVEQVHIREELQHLSHDLDTRAADKTAELIAAECHVAMPEDVIKNTESNPGDEVVTESQIGDFTGLLNVINGYAMLMKEDLNEPAKLHDDIEAISEATSLIKKLINSRSAQRLT